MHRLLRELCHAHSPAVLLVTHDVDEAVLLADRTIVLHGGKIILDEVVRLSPKLLVPRLRTGAVVMCDNVQQFDKEYRDYKDFVRGPMSGFRSMLWPKQGGTELSVWVGVGAGNNSVEYPLLSDGCGSLRA